MQDEQHDPFEDASSAAVSEAEITTDKGDGKTEEAKTGDKQPSSEPPADGQQDKDASSAEKMIPESRFKAALKDVSDKLDAALRENANLKAIPTPDKETDPEGYDLHLRMEASKQVMRELVPDYDEVIRHYKEMADQNPFLNDHVAKHQLPAKFAYDIAKKDLALKEVEQLRNSDDWKEFQEFKKQKAVQVQDSAAANSKTAIAAKIADSLTKVPNLNKATDVSRSVSRNEDDDLFVGKL